MTVTDPFSSDQRRETDGDSEIEDAQPGQDPTDTDHAVGKEQAAENDENELPA